MTTADDRAFREEASGFEREVRRIAGLLYPEDGSAGATMVDGRETDGVFITEDAAIAIEATISREKAKAEKDGRKLKALAEQLAKRHPYKAIKGFFVTRTDPTAHQLDAIKRIGSPIIAISYAKFRARLIDGRAYIDARNYHAFGSARDPETNDVQLHDSYVSIDFVDVIDRRKQHTLEAIVEATEGCRRVVLIGDFGAGKSMTLREIYMHYAKRHRKNDQSKFCLHLNLNDHRGQVEPVEALIRHAHLIAFAQPHQLVRAWRSGEAHIILDGFDEVYVPGWATSSRPLADIRRRSVQLIKQFMTDTPLVSSVIVAGRAHFFDGLSELQSALGVPKGALIASATDFTEEQVQQYLRNRRWHTTLPDWLPRRPLIVGYLAGRRLFDVVDNLAFSDPGQGWHRLLSELCAREARADAGVDEEAIREIVERLATQARRTPGGLGPIQFEDLVAVFRDLRGYLPDEGAYTVLQRLPGLRVNDSQTNSRLFVDDDLVDASRAGDVLRWIRDPYLSRLTEAVSDWQNLLGEVGLAVLKYRLEESGLTHRHVQNALALAHSKTGVGGLQADLLRLLLALGSAPSKPLTLTDQHIPSIYLAETADASMVTLSGCIVDLLDLSDVETAERLPSMRGCAITVVAGVAGIDELATSRITDCEFGTFTESAENMAAILKLDLPDYTRVALTMLRKIFVQSGRSRKEGALFRGSLTTRQKELIPDVLTALQREGAIRQIRRRGATLWEPNRAMYRRVRQILDTPTTSVDPLITGAR